jgi:serine protease Do
MYAWHAPVACKESTQPMRSRSTFQIRQSAIGSLLFALLVIVPGSPACATKSLATDAGGRDIPSDIQAAVQVARDRVFPALVNISVVSVSHWGGKETKGASIGSGTIISPDGLVVTNQHVVDNGRTFRVTLSDKREVSATLVGEDRMTDLAVLRLDMSQLRDVPLPAVATWGDSDAIKVGDYVLAMGAPWGLSRSVTLGIVSNTERVFTSMSGDDIAEQEFDFDSSTDIFTRWIQHDALILPGNSGGPLVNLKGEIVGVNTRGGAGLGFANPSSLARTIVAQLIRNGEVIRSTIGVALKSTRRTGFSEGVLLNSVDADGPAAKAGLKAGDILLTLDGQAIQARFPEEIPIVLRTIAERPIGSTLRLTYRRGTDTGVAEVTTERMLPFKGDEVALRLFGLSAAEITQRIARARRLTSLQGAYVLGVRGGGPAATAEPSLNAGDVILGVNGKPVRTLRDLVGAYEAIAGQDPLPEYVTVEFDRAGKNTLTLIKPRPDKKEDPPRELPKAWIGVATQPVLKELARQIGLGDRTGFRVTRVYPNTTVAKSDLRVGDVIVALNGEPLSPRGMQDAGMFQRAVRRLQSGQEVSLTVVRERSETQVVVTLERTRLTPEEALRDQNRDFEISVRELTFFDRDDNRWEDSVQGVLVENVEQAGWAGFAGIYPGDLIQQVDGQSVTDIQSWRDVMADIARRQPERVTFVVLRGLRTQFMFAEPQWKPLVPTDGQQPEAGKSQ